MLKTERRFVLFEQIETLLGKNRNEKDIIEKTIELLDSINEETVYNQLLKSWKKVLAFKRDPKKPLNEFFSEFETMQYSLNLADNSYKEPEPTMILQTVNHYKERERKG